MKKYLCMLLSAALMAVTLAACNTNETSTDVDSDSTAESPNATQTDTEDESEAMTDADIEPVLYTVNIATSGGRSFNQRLNFLIYQGDVAIRHGITDLDGSAYFELPLGGTYALQIISALPTGYTVDDAYPLTDLTTHIRIPSAVIDSTDLLGVSYRLGDVMRDFTVTDVDGNEHTLSQTLTEKKAVMLNFWYVGCDPCKAEFPHMQAAYAAQSNVEILAMNDTRETVDQIKSCRDTAGLTFPVIKEQAGLSSAFALKGYPTTVIIDRYGVICFIHTGGLTEEQFAKIFAYFSAENYTQALFNHIDEIPEIG